MVGAGIGVTPFASVLADLVNRLETKKCKLCNRVRGLRKYLHLLNLHHGMEITQL